jgi:hypothetical protein
VTATPARTNTAVRFLNVAVSVATLINLGVAIATYILVVRQTDIMDEQTRLAREQTKLAHQQTKIMQKQDEILGRRAILDVRRGTRRTWAVGPDQFQAISLMAYNSGFKGADAFNWHVFVPKDAGVEEILDTGISEDVVIDGKSYRHYTGRTMIPLYPKEEPRDFARIRRKGDAAIAMFRIRWYISADDGVFPGQRPDGSVEHGQIEIDFKRE